MAAAREIRTAHPRVPTPLAPALLRYAREHGADAGELARRFGLDGAATDEAAISVPALRALFDEVAIACAEPLLGLRLAAAPPSSTKYAPLELAVRSARTVAEALECLARFAALVHPALRAEWSPPDATWTQEPATRVALESLGGHADSYALGFVLARCREACSEPSLTVRAAAFAHARPRDLTPLQRFFGTEALTFGAERSGFTLHPEVARAPLATHDERLHATALELARDALARRAPPKTTASLVAAALRDALAERPSLDAVARRLAMSERTLQRRLLDERTSFLDVLDAVRETRARELLREPARSLVEVADDLGFADLATFCRAFKRWTGEPPGTFRRRRLACG